MRQNEGNEEIYAANSPDARCSFQDVIKFTRIPERVFTLMLKLKRKCDLGGSF